MQVKLATFISNKLFVANLLREDDVEIMIYYLENILSFIMIMCPIIIISIFSGQVLESAIYLISFFLGRACAGGYHAKNHLTCFLLSVGTYLLFLFFLNIWRQFDQQIVLVWALVIVTNIIIFIFSPADSPNKRFTEKEKKYYRKKSIGLLFVHNILFVLLSQSYINLYSFSLFYGVFQLAVSVMLARLLDPAMKQSIL